MSERMKRYVCPEKPIIFTGEMVLAILQGRKTQTRRVVIPQPPEPRFADTKCPYGKVGDLLWVRETWRCTGGGSWYLISYKATESDGDARAYVGCERCGCLAVPGQYREQWEHYVYETSRSCDWRSSIFMPKWACRLWLKVKTVRVQRVQDISEEDSLAEGIECRCNVGNSEYDRCSLTAEEHFAMLWESINAKRGYGWEVNPWVWVIEFERACVSEPLRTERKKGQ